MFGLPDNVLKLLHRYFSADPQIVKVIIFGSRAMGRDKPGSDIDLAIITTGDRDLSAKVKAELDELSTPYLFDVVDYQRIDHQPLREHIDRVGKVFFQQASILTITIQSFFEHVWNQKNLKAAEEIFEPDAVIHGSISDFKGIQAIQEMFHSWLVAFPDLKYQAVEILSFGDKAACRFYGTGTHRSTFLGIPETRRKIEHKGIEIFHFSDRGRIRELWAFSNMLEIFKQLSAAES